VQSEESKERQSIAVEFSIGEHVDCLDSVNKWCNGEIVSVSNYQHSFLYQKKGTCVKVHFTGWTAKYDEWLDIQVPNERERLKKQWRRGMAF